MEKWRFGTNNDELIELVLSGVKIATSSLYKEGEVPVIGEESIILYDDGREACVIKTKSYKIIKFSEMTEGMALLEGEGDLSLNYWKDVHYNFFKSIDENFDENSMIIFEEFEVVKK